MTHRQRFFLAETDRFQLRVGYTQGLEFMEHRFGASFAERQVVFRCSPFVGITLDQYVPVWMASEILGVGLQERLIVAFDGVTVEVEVDAAFRKLPVGVVELVDLSWRDIGRLRASCATRTSARCLIQFWPGMTSRKACNQQHCDADLAPVMTCLLDLTNSRVEKLLILKAGLHTSRRELLGNARFPARRCFGPTRDPGMPCAASPGQQRPSYEKHVIHRAVSFGLHASCGLTGHVILSDQLIQPT